jgi:hypothetical protein
VARNGIRVTAALLVAALAGCSDGGRRDAKDEALRRRLDGIEKRLATLESMLGPVTTVAARLGRLESRLAALEPRPASGSLVGGADTAAPAAQPAPPGAQWTPPATGPGGQDDAVTALRQEFQARLARIPADATPEARQQAIRELGQWYAAQYRALAGTAPWDANR